MEKRYILIITTSGDQSTNSVMDWIRSRGYFPLRLNTDKLFLDNRFSLSLNFGIDNNHILITVNNQCIKYKSIKSIWFRKFAVPKFADIYESVEDIGNFTKHIKAEYFSAMFAFFDLWKNNISSLGGSITKQPTKMEMLINAKKFTIDIPETIITDNKKELQRFLAKHKGVITKPIRGGNQFYKKDKNGEVNGAMLFTELLNNSVIDKIPNYFFYTMFQEKLDKDFEIRVFYLDEKCYSMAIFSQLDKQTDIDLRMYNNERGNRTNPYQLPRFLEVKINKLMQSLNLKTGSLDIVKTKDNRFVFLEVNPWGQYGMVSDPCNYFLDDEIAKYLTNE